jgi:glutamate 5-kinase
MTDPLASARLIVVKVGSTLIVDAKAGTARREWLKSLVADLATLRREGKQVVLVSSGAIALGRRVLKLPAGPLKLEESQAAAAVGQVRLAGAYAELFRAEALAAAQVLLTLGDTEKRDRYLNARATLKTLLELGAVPVINENDTVTTAEIRFGDNDRLSAGVASMIEADSLILLSDVDGLYRQDPTLNPEAEHIPVVETVTAEIESMAGGSISGMGRGGMETKLVAARIAAAAGCETMIALGKAPHPIAAIRQGARTTRFLAASTPAAARKRWIVGIFNHEGGLAIDDGAVAALHQGKSLLPAGIKRIDGRFERGDVVTVCDMEGREIARGLAAYAVEDVERIAGKRSLEIRKILGYRYRGDEMIHRDDLALIDRTDTKSRP